MSSANLIWLLASVAEAAVIGLLLFRRVWRTFPLFFAYSVWTLANSGADYLIVRNYPLTSPIYVTVYLAGIVVDSVLLFGVLVELGWSILRPVRSSLSPIALVPVAFVIFVVGAAIWPFASYPGASRLSHEVATLMHMQQTFSILRVVVFLGLAAFSQLLSIGWRDRELQIATGLGFTSLVGLAVAMIHTHQSSWVQYGHLNEIVVASYLCSLVYWIVSFAQKEAERKEFTPQMRDFLLAAAGAARSARIGLTDSRASNIRKPGPR
ncbi:MAG TPA: hypothetical protein VMA34_19910 [Terracidiphilus sp.]|nr:hypothetical protein [Terracidiphilus sp.]